MVHHTNHSKTTIKLSPLIAGAVFVVSAVLAPTLTRAADLNQLIRQKQAEQAQAQAQASALGQQAQGVQGEINALQEQIAAIQAQIDVNTARQAELTQQIESAQKKLDEQKELLSANIRSMYIEGDISPLEMIASSKNLGDFVDKQEYRDRIKENISSTMDEIERLKKQLDDQRKEVTKILDEQKTLRASLDEKNAEAGAKLASINQDKAVFDGQVRERASEVRALIAQQAAIERARNAWTGGYITTGGTGGYPWANAPIGPGGWSRVVDDWALYARQCTSYVAWKLSSQGYGVKSFNGAGNANEWPSTTASYTSQTYGIPHKGDAAVQYLGEFGHVMYVESVNGDNTIDISEYNWIQNSYSERRIPKSSYQYYTFITFPRR